MLGCSTSPSPNSSRIHQSQGSEGESEEKKEEKEKAKKALEALENNLPSDVLTEDDLEASSEEEPDSPRVNMARKVRISDDVTTYQIKKVKFTASDIRQSVKSLKSAKENNDMSNTIMGKMSDDIQFRGQRC